MKGFTLLELIIVIVIIGILATLGFTQYTNLIENMRSAEAKSNIGLARKNFIAYYMANGTMSGLTSSDLGIGTPPGQLPLSCNSNFYYSYSWWQSPAFGDSTTIAIAATRCTSGGKSPQASQTYDWRYYYDTSPIQEAWSCYVNGVQKWWAPGSSSPPASCP